MEALIVIFAFVTVMTIHQSRARERRDKLRLLDEAIRSGHVDPATKEQLVAELTGRRSAAPAQQAPHGALARLVFAVGWIALFVGGGLLTIPYRDAVAAGGIVLVTGFALVTLPIAMRELDRERFAAPRSSPPRS